MEVGPDSPGEPALEYRECGTAGGICHANPDAVPAAAVQPRTLAVEDCLRKSCLEKTPNTHGDLSGYAVFETANQILDFNGSCVSPGKL